MFERAVHRVLRASPRVLPHIGGQEVHVDELTRNLASLGIEQTLAYAHGAPDIHDLQTVRLHVPPLPSDIAMDVVFGWRVARWAQEGYQVVHTHGDAPVARGGAIAARRIHAAHVHTFHGDLVARGPRATMLRALLPKRSWYLAVSRGVATSLAQAGAAHERIFIRPSGVREEFFRSAGARTPDVAIGGRLIPEKGIGQFASAWASADTGTSHLKVFGAGPEAPMIEGLAREAKNVEWLGTLDAEGLSEVLTSVAVGVVTGRAPSETKSNEGTPTLALEMLAAGCFPVVGSTTGEAPRFIEDLSFGEVHDQAPSPTDTAMLAVTWSQSEMEATRTRARASARSSFEWRAVALQIRDLYELAYERSRSRR